MKTILLRTGQLIPLFVLLLNTGARPSPSPGITWIPTHLSVQVFAGASRSVKVSFQTNAPFDDLEVFIVPELRVFVSAIPYRLAPIHAGEVREISLTVRTPRETAPGTVEGTLHLRSSGHTIGRPLTIDLEIGTPAPAIDLLQAFLTSQFGTITPPTPNGVDSPAGEELPQSVINAFQPGGDAMLLSFGSPLHFASSFDANSTLQDAVSRLLTVVESKGILVDDLRAALSGSKLHREITDTGGLALSRYGVYGVTIKPVWSPIKVEGSPLPDFFIVTDQKTHIILQGVDADELIAHQFASMAGILNDSASTALHELCHAMIFRTGCFNGSSEAEETLVQALEGALSFRFFGNDRGLAQAQQQAISAGGADCLRRLGLLQPHWAKLETMGEPPYPRSAALTPVYDASSNRLITFGGLTYCCTSFNDVWILTNANGFGGAPQWIKLNPIGPAGFPVTRGHNSAVYDSANNRMIIFGGGQFNGSVFSSLFNDVWVLTHANGLGGTPEWIPLLPAGGPPERRAGHRAIYDPATNRMTVFGGGNNGIMSVPNDLWVLTNANGLSGTPEWIQLNPTGQIPPPLEAHSATYDRATNRMTIFGGCCPFTNDTRVLKNANGLGGTPEWIQLSPAGTLPTIRGTWVFGYNPIQSRVVIFGQGNSSGVVNDTWILTSANGAAGTPGWINTIPNGAAGSPSSDITISGGLYDPVSNRLIFLRGGGDVPPTTGIEVWVLSNANGN